MASATGAGKTIDDWIGESLKHTRRDGLIFSWLKYGRPYQDQSIVRDNKSGE
jgi:hypothetical protein